MCNISFVQVLLLVLLGFFTLITLHFVVLVAPVLRFCLPACLPAWLFFVFLFFVAAQQFLRGLLSSRAPPGIAHCRAAVPRLNESAVDFVARTEKKEVVNETADGILVNLHLRHVAIVV